MHPKLETITEAPRPSPEAVAAAKKTGATLVPYDPRRMRAFLEGRITLGDLEGIPKDTQYRMAEVGYSFLSEGQVDQAETVFKGLIALDPYDAYFHTVRASIAHRKGDIETADRHYTRALEINPFSVSALANRGELRLSRGDVEGALEDLVRSIDLDKEGKEMCSQRARVILDALLKRAQAYPVKKAAPAGKKPAPARRPTPGAKPAAKRPGSGRPKGKAPSGSRLNGPRVGARRPTPTKRG